MGFASSYVSFEYICKYLNEDLNTKFRQIKIEMQQICLVISVLEVMECLGTCMQTFDLCNRHFKDGARGQ